MLLFQDAYFDGHLADSEDLLTRVHRLRYQVYCVEAGFEPLEQPVAGEEHDEYDNVSTHFLICHRQSGLDAGTARLILPGTLNGCPFFKATQSVLTASDLVDSPQVGEVSRLAISKTVRRRISDHVGLFGSMDTARERRRDTSRERRTEHGNPSPHPGMLMALYRCVYQYSKCNDIVLWYSLMEPALKRLVSRLGFIYEQIGPVIDYHGRRAPFRWMISAGKDEVSHTHPQIWDYLRGRQ